MTKVHIAPERARCACGHARSRHAAGGACEEPHPGAPCEAFEDAGGLTGLVERTPPVATDAYLAAARAIDGGRPPARNR